ncbi:MAG TPA: undecaprenyl-diphosphatase UppP [Anaerolineae bacterium]|nr:undecaprenyl-diphosphatase UppP [Anaerolineae bacterium]
MLGIVQGATEFLPVSSSGHLVLVPWLLHWESMGLAFGALLHLGTLVAVVAFFWRDLWQLVVAGLLSVKERSLAGDPVRKTAWLIVLGSLPAALLGFTLEDFFESLFGRPVWVGILLVVTGTLLAASERWSRRKLEMTELGWVEALVVGLGQAVAIAPGISRSGATISAGLWRGLRREAAARFSFLLSVPIILGAGLFELKDVFDAPMVSDSPLTLAVGFASAAVSGFLSIRFLLRYLQTRSLYPFAIYCWAGGLVSVLFSILGIR